MYLLDTNVCIRYINGRSPSIVRILPTIPARDINVSVITKAELFYGSAKSQTFQRSRQKQMNFLKPIRIISLTNEVLEQYALIRADLEKRGLPIGSNDLFIAATARAYNLTLITHNTLEFGRVPNLLITDWEADSSP